MVVLEYTLLASMLCLGTIAAVSDIRDGIVPNKLIAVFAIYGVVLDIVYYAILAPDTALVFILNLATTTVISLVLYFMHALAGGDCKLIPVMSLLYPAGMYLSYGSNSITLFAAICFAIFFGYMYMLAIAAWKLIVGETRIDKGLVANAVNAYLKSYIVATIYVMFVNMLLTLVYEKLFQIDTWIIMLACMLTAWLSGRIPFFRKRMVIVIALLLDILLAVYLKIIPISLNPGSYMFTGVLLLFQMTIRTNLYEQIQTSRVKKGMILSSFSTLLMQGSKIEGLPGLSTEDLRDRLTEPEAESVRRWGRSANGAKEVSIVRKIPFAIFITIGYLCYFVIWRIVK